MAAYSQRNSVNLCMIFVLTWTLQVQSSSLPLSNSGLIQLKNLWKPIESIGFLPASSQKVMVKAMGEEYVIQNITHCNVFGGGESCLSIADYTNYTQSCNSKNKFLDCVFEMDLQQSNFGDLLLVLQQYAGADHIDCADCHEKFEKFLCAVTAPPCGTIDKVMDEIPLLISSVASKKSSTTMSLQNAVPRVIQAASLGFPCKTMCEAVLESCGCVQQPTFGEVMEAIEVDSQRSAMNTMGLSIKELFHFIWDEHVCDIFSEESVPGFFGACGSLNRSSKCNLCNGVKGSNSIQKEVVKNGVVQLSQMVIKLLQGGLEEILSAMDHPKKFNSHVGQATSHSNQRKRGGHAGLLVLVVGFMALVIFSFVVSIKMSRNHQAVYQYVDLSSMGYTPPML